MSFPPCPGFRFAGARGGLKKGSGKDVGLIVCDGPSPAAAAVFTSNRVQAAPVRVARAALAASRGRLRAVVVNSGNANACTGTRGVADARRMAVLAGTAAGVASADVLVASTGVIGVPLAMDQVAAGIDAAGAALSPDGFGDFAHAILTTDRRAKIASRTIAAGGAIVTLLGCTKGAGMIAPNMATTLTFVVTDARVAPTALARATRAACAPTYNAIAVDGDTSTNDTLAVLASGATGRAVTGPDLARFTTGLTDLLHDLATMLMSDGEGVHHVVTLEVVGAASDAAAAQVARRIAVSPLVKTAIAGGDPNWGRILCAAGNAGVAIDPDRLGLTIGAVEVVRRGHAIAGFDEAAAAAVMKQPAYTITVRLGRGRGRARFLACDLSHEYVSINADYRT